MSRASRKNARVGIADLPDAVRDFRDSRLSSFDPRRDVPGNIVAWYDFSTLSGADGDGVGFGPDLSGQGNSLRQSAPANRPTRATASDGKTVLRFESGQVMTSRLGTNWPTGGPVAAPLTILATIKGKNVTPPTDPVLLGGIGGAGTQIRMVTSSTSGAVVAYGGTGITTPVGPNIFDGQWHVVAISVDVNGSGSAFVDGLMTSSRSSGMGTDGLASVVLGALGTGGGNQFLGDIREALVVQGRLPLDAVSAISKVLASRAPTPPAIGSAAAGFAPDDTTSSNGQAVRLFTPDQEKTPRVFVIWCHPQGQNQQVGPGYFAHSIEHAALARGWYFAASNMHGADNWGNPDSQADCVDLVNLMTARYGAPAHVILVGASMGAQAAAKLLVSGDIANTRGAYFIDGATNLRAMYDGDTYAASIRTGYGIASDGSDYATKTNGQDPHLIATASYTGKRMRFVASPDDTAVSKTSNSDAMIAKVAAVAAEASAKTHLMGHLNGGAADPADFLAFVDRCIA